MMTIPPVRTPSNLFTHTITISTYSYTPDAGGMPKRDSSPTSTVSVQAAVQPTSSQNILLYGRDTNVRMFDVFADPLTTTGTTWTLTQKDRVGFNGENWQVVGNPQDLCSMGVLKKFTIELET